MVLASESKVWLTGLVVMTVMVPGVSASEADIQEPFTIDSDFLTMQGPIKALQSRSVADFVASAAIDPSPVEEIQQKLNYVTGTVGNVLTDPPVSVPKEVPYQPPQNLELEHVNENEVVLNWEAPSSEGATAYLVYRTDLPNFGALPNSHRAAISSIPIPRVIAELEPGITSYTDNGVTLDTQQYAYFVTATYDAPATSGKGPELDLTHVFNPMRSMTLSPTLVDEVESIPSNLVLTLNAMRNCPMFVLDLDPIFFDLKEECFLPAATNTIPLPLSRPTQVS